FDVTAAITRCLNHDAPAELVTARSWPALHTGWTSFRGLGNALTTTAGPGREGILTDPVTQASVTQNPLSYRGCRKIASDISDPNAATWTFPLKQKVTMLGAPVIDVSYTTTSPDTELAVRLWDVDPSSGLQALVTRGVYRAFGGVGSGQRARFEIAPNGYRWPAGHILKIEITSNDEPYYQASNIPGVVQITSMLLTLPTR
ncbi:MAG TPA: CocE/NonD family hydrolase C-terminal non-catalytic domain-containing protein, partial [Actinomycetota bacterium]|nr:CocE/NonD family hydrolase C-terminal non-catalytic domain-containing protein [Actinomycetota bacterium]